jgi:hypothetical protein
MAVDRARQHKVRRRRDSRQLRQAAIGAYSAGGLSRTCRYGSFRLDFCVQMLNATFASGELG